MCFLSIFFISRFILFDLHSLCYLAYSFPHDGFISFPDRDTHITVFLLDRNSRNYTLFFKLYVLSKLAGVWKEKQTQIIPKSYKRDHLSENPHFKIPEVYPTDSVNFLVCAAHLPAPHNLRSLYRAQQDRSKLCHTHLRAARRKPKEIHSDVNGDLMERRKKKHNHLRYCDSFNTVDFVTW